MTGGITIDSKASHDLLNSEIRLITAESFVRFHGRSIFIGKGGETVRILF